jgi:hypothetical protein
MANSAYNDSDDLSFPVNIVDPWNNLEYTYNDLIGIYDDTTRTVRSSLKTGCLERLVYRLYSYTLSCSV